ncbi:hypothetical protein HJ588_16585 [Flexivirga sp. ID2601S]|uniref:Uncharacterized protein n=1 Tax=Flexivirga aerilata TaxID=1656889 RepID=A0A849AM62_9MICO|nr:hypothetical protein [Flexivirga aerilata]NNG40877.1 hypothetical protein [Flexivirga aerilata]
MKEPKKYMARPTRPDLPAHEVRSREPEYRQILEDAGLELVGSTTGYEIHEQGIVIASGFVSIHEVGDWIIEHKDEYPDVASGE